MPQSSTTHTHTQCRPYNFGSTALLLGDAAHAMVPFFGQGMNAGFEDCLLLSQIFDQHGDDFSAILRDFSDQRWDNAHAVCDLALKNYEEVLLKKK